jgi:hypothetical protein
VASIGALAGALLLVIVPWPPLASVEVFSETVDIRPGAQGWGIVATGVAAAALAITALVRRNPLWAAGVILPGLVAMVWSGWWAFVRLPEIARLADAASLSWGGIGFVLAGPALVLSGTLAMFAVLQDRSSRQDASAREPSRLS